MSTMTVNTRAAYDLSACLNVSCIQVRDRVQQAYSPDGAALLALMNQAAADVSALGGLEPAQMPALLASLQMVADRGRIYAEATSDVRLQAHMADAMHLIDALALPACS